MANDSFPYIFHDFIIWFWRRSTMNCVILDNGTTLTLRSSPGTRKTVRSSVGWCLAAGGLRRAVGEPPEPAAPSASPPDAERPTRMRDPFLR